MGTLYKDVARGHAQRIGIGTDEIFSAEAAAASTLGKINLCRGETMNRTRVYVCCAILATGSVAALAAQKGDAAKGKEVFGQCAVCHNADSTDKKMGPGLKGHFKHDKLVNGKKVTDATVRDQIEQGGNGMPSYKDMLSDTEKDDLIAYLKTL
jgi:mono/diheme cytochrome c family protein